MLSELPESIGDLLSLKKLVAAFSELPTAKKPKPASHQNEMFVLFSR
jgi:hypothetical protein